MKYGRNVEAILSAALILSLICVGCAGSVEIGTAPGEDGADSDESGAGVASIPASRAGKSSSDGFVERVGASASDCALESVKPVPVRRLSHTEYNRTVAALFPGIEIPKQEFAADLSIHGFENNAAAMNASPVLVEQYGEAAARIAELAAANLDAVLPCATSGDDMTCAGQFIASFGLHAFRRPLGRDELDRYEGFFAERMSEEGFNAAAELTIQAFLQSPQFLYRLELGDANEDADHLVAVDDHAMASRLSYLLWQSMPDSELFDAAARGELHTATQIEAQARRMLEQPAAHAALIDFHRQWLDFDRLLTEDKDATLFPDWNDELQAAMREESDRFVADVFSEGSGTVAELLTSNTSFVNAELAEFYGVEVSGDGWQRVTLPSERAGILTRANFLASHAHSTNGSPPLRGVAVLDQLLCSRPPPPPPSLDTSFPASSGAEPMTNRELFEARTSKSECQGCHASINGIGYGLEAFDSIGGYRETDHGLPVDASGVLMSTSDVNGPYDGAVELSNKLAESKQVEECAVRNVYRYALARAEESADGCKLDALYAAMANSGGDVRELLVSIATSYEFMHRAPVSVQGD